MAKVDYNRICPGCNKRSRDKSRPVGMGKPIDIERCSKCEKDRFKALNGGGEGAYVRTGDDARFGRRRGN